MVDAVQIPLRWKILSALALATAPLWLPFFIVGCLLHDTFRGS